MPPALKCGIAKDPFLYGQLAGSTVERGHGNRVRDPNFPFHVVGSDGVPDGR